MHFLVNVCWHILIWMSCFKCPSVVCLSIESIQLLWALKDSLSGALSCAPSFGMWPGPAMHGRLPLCVSFDMNVMGIKILLRHRWPPPPHQLFEKNLAMTVYALADKLWILQSNIQSNSSLLQGCSSPLVVKFADTQRDKEQRRLQQQLVQQIQQLNNASTWGNLTGLGTLTPQYLAVSVA